VQPDLVEEIAAIIAAASAEPSRVRLEITESVLIENVQVATRIFQRLKGIGVQLSMDDFGTGYSSLGNLHRFQMDTLKIDQSFVSGMVASPQQGEIVRTIISLARTLGMSVVAEGVETREQCDMLAGLACDQGQGYLFSRPVKAAGATALIVRGIANARGGS
jgi:EAL domain-containing protein (putative c-di-GMP-specific phosphodiesterase class I)